MDGAQKYASIAPTGVAAILILFGTVAQAPAQADEHLIPVAIIEALEDGSGADRTFEFLGKGAVLNLGASGTAIIGYFQSCIQETIQGGKVAIGLEQSEIRGGTVTRERIDCDGAKLVLTPAQLAESAVTVNRGPNAATTGGGVITVHSTKPYIVLKNPTAVVIIRRADVAGEPPIIETVAAGVTGNIRIPKQNLQPGAVYSITTESASRQVRIDHNARATGVPLLSKILLM